MNANRRPTRSLAGGIIVLTRVAEFALQSGRVTLRRPKQVHEIGQGQQISDPERATARGYRHERISVGSVGPIRWQRAQLTPLVVVTNAVLTPVTAAGHELQLPTAQRMERMGHPNDPLIALNGCS